jgi:hypothetical protein
MHIAVSPRLLGSGEPLFAGLDLPGLGYGSVSSTSGEKAVHYVITRDLLTSHDAVPGDGHVRFFLHGLVACCRIASLKPQEVHCHGSLVIASFS